MILIALPARAQVMVKTLGGGLPSGIFHGCQDGNTWAAAEFDGPVALALDADGNLYLADKNNGRIRKITYPGNTSQGSTNSSMTSTLISGLNQPVGVTALGNYVYVLTQGDGKLRKYERYGGALQTTITTALTNATALTMDSSTNFYVTIAPAAGGGMVKKVTYTGVVSILTNNFTQPQGIVLLGNGLLAVSDTGSNAVRFIHPVTGTNVLVTGGNGAGFLDGPAQFAQFNLPWGLATSLSGNLVVADRMNHRVRMITTNGLTSTIYGLDPSRWIAPSPPLYYPGWWDGSVLYAEAREPVSAVVGSDGTLFTTELYYNLLRSVTGAPLGLGGGSGGGTNGSSTNLAAIPSPWFSPTYGYYPMGVDIIVASAFPVYYTTDGSEPVPGNLSTYQVALTNGNSGIISWSESSRDLTSLRLKAIDGTNSSITVSGVRAPVNELGVTRGVWAGSSSTIHIPVIVNMRSNHLVRSLQYLVAITPQTNAQKGGWAPPVLPSLDAVSISTNDFIQVAGASVPGTIGRYDVWPYDLANPTNGLDIPGGLAIFSIGTNANFQVGSFGTVAMLKVPIDPAAREGDSYSITFANLSATSDGENADEPVTLLPPQTLTVSNLWYTVGDSSPSRWYGAGDFGDGDLKNNDVNNAFYASLGLRTPFSYTDLFDAMDVFPVDTLTATGGDGEIRYLDWQIILRRSLGLDPNNYRRKWTVGGGRVSDATHLVKAMQAKSAAVALPGDVWSRQARVSSAVLTNLLPGSPCNVPVYASVGSGCALAGMQFRAKVMPEGKAPPVTAVAFSPNTGNSQVKAPYYLGSSAPNEAYCAWNIQGSSSFSPALQGDSNLLGNLVVSIPAGARLGDHYTIRFVGVDGGPNLTTSYRLESVPGSLWVLAAAAPPEIISDEWKTNFFGSVDNPNAASAVDYDGDGVPNWMEYLAGTNPTNATSCLHLLAPQWSKGTDGASRGWKLRWLSAPGKNYVIERKSALRDSAWTPMTTPVTGDGNLDLIIDTNASVRAQFYRIRLP